VALKRRRIAATILGAIVLVATVVIGSPAMAGDVSAASADYLPNQWKTSTNGIKQTLTLTKDGKVSGDSGCNRYVGGYTISGSSITFGPLAGTLMACPDPQMKAEAAYLAKLQSATKFKATLNTLTLYKGSKRVLTFTSVFPRTGSVAPPR